MPLAVLIPGKSEMGLNKVRPLALDGCLQF